VDCGLWIDFQLDFYDWRATRGTARCQKKREEERTKEVVVFIDILFFEKEKATKSHTVQYLYLKERDEIGATNGKIYASLRCVLAVYRYIFTSDNFAKLSLHFGPEKDCSTFALS